MQQATDQRPYEAELKRLDEQHAVILHHRGEAYQAVGDEEQAQADFSKAKELGYNPEAGVW
jgi:predicted negative regulator of RcsB-dependent stress response